MIVFVPHMKSFLLSVRNVIQIAVRMQFCAGVLLLAVLAGAVIGNPKLANDVFVGSAMAQNAANRNVSVGQSGLPLPRFVSLKSNRVNVRVGPGQEYEVSWIYVRGGLPVEVTQEFDNWRRVRDSAGNEGWVFHSLLSGRRTAIVAPWDGRTEPLPLFRERNPGAKLNARLETGLLIKVNECDGTWCHAEIDAPNDETYEGYVQQERIWGVYPGEVF